MDIFIVKVFHGCSKELIDKLGSLVDRMSINIELPSNDSLKLLAPQKEKSDIIPNMQYISNNIDTNRYDKNRFKTKFVPAGQTTQMIIGATPESDFKILKLSEGLYKSLKLKRVYYSAYVSVNNDKNLPSLTSPPLLRENRLYQADWLLRFYGFKADELLCESHPNFNLILDPKCDWALRNIDKFPIEINKADYFSLLRIPGIGVISAKKIIKARRSFSLDFECLKKLGVVLKRAKYFITCKGKYYDKVYKFNQSFIETNLTYQETSYFNNQKFEQLSLFNNQNTDLTYEKNKTFNNLLPTKEDKIKCLTGNL